VSAFLPYGRQHIDDDDIAAVVEVLREPLITQGPRVDELEAAFADAVQASHAVAFSSGTAGLHAAAAAAGLGPGDEVLTTPLSFVASSNCALFVGARPRFADVDPATHNLDAAAAIAAGTADGVRACVPVSLTGLPADLAPLQALRARGVTVIEDACHALGALRDGRPVGSDGLADMAVFSLHPVKAVTSGEGGVVTTGDAELADRLRAFRTHGIRRVTGDGVLAGGWHYDVASLGFNYRITDFQSALGRSQLRKLDAFVARRNALAAAYRAGLEGLDGVALPAEPGPGGRHAYHLFVVRFTEGAARRRAVYDGLRERGIGTQLHYIPIYRHSLYRSLGYGDDPGAFPNTERYYEQALSLPLFPELRDADVDRVVGAIAEELQRPL
jgi:UDP-4-amino-4,6-dideoxy-N-acetyl-beta-L-altrosamine transaminase